jgi:flagellum-specific peptidoglycan hydrolase FlgJ
MTLTKAEREANLTRIAAAAVAVEGEFGIPAELCMAQCILESAWLAKAPGNNPFGIKATAGQPFRETVTWESLTPAQLARLKQSGARLLAIGPLVGGRHRVSMIDRFAAFDTLEDAFRAYGKLLLAGRHFAPRLARFRGHGDLRKLLADLRGADGQPPYATDPEYDTKLLRLIGQANVQAALAAARRAEAA